MALTQVKALGIAADSIDETKLADDSIDSEHYNDGSIDNAHIADDAIDSEHYVDGSIDTAHLADDAVTLAKMASGTDGNIISFDASGNPVAIATGNDGQVLTSTGAGSPPAFEDAAAGGATINNATENELVTVASTTTQLDAEANLTYDGTSLTLAAPAGASNLANLIINARNSSDQTRPSAKIQVACNASESWTSQLIFTTRDSNTDFNEALRITGDDPPNVKVTNGNLVIGTAGKGIDFSTTSDVAGMASELLDDYEEGTWTPDSPAASASSNSGKYTKIGSQVIFEGSLTFGSESGNNRAEINGLPFTAAGNYGGGYIRYTNVNPGEEWFSLDIGNGTAIIQMNESSPDSIKRNDVSTKRIDFCGQYIV